MSNFAQRASEVLAPVSREYRLRTLVVNDEELLLIGPDFALDFAADFDTVHVAYVERTRTGELVMVGIKPFLSEQRFTTEDRATFGQPVGRQGYLDASLRVITTGLARHADDILRGDRQWLLRLRSRDPVRWGGLGSSRSLRVYSSRYCPYTRRLHLLGDSAAPGATGVTITTTTFDAIHLCAFELHSAQCPSVQTVLLTDELWDVIGVVCNTCRTHLWLNNRRHSILGRARPEFPTREAYLAWNVETDRAFFASLPPCPVCRSGRFTRYVTNVPEQPLICPESGLAITDARWINVSSRYAGTPVYWYEEELATAI